MKILIGMPAGDSWGGPASSEPPFVEALRRLGVDVTEETYVYGDKEKPTPFFERIRRVVKTASIFRRILKNQDFDIIHLNTALDLKTLLRDCVSLRLMKPGRAKVFLKIHGTESEYLKSSSPLISVLRNDLNNRVDGLGIHTSEEKADYIKAGFDSKKLFFVKNVVTLNEKFFEDFSRRQKSADEIFSLLFVSRFVPKKSLVETIQACSIIRDKGYKFVLHAVGDGETRAEAERETAKLNLAANVKFTGYLPEEEVTKYFFNGDLLVFPTQYGEGFPNVFFKAVAAGMPIVSTRFRAAKDYLHENENCLFCKATPESIAEKIIELIENKALRETMSANNLEFGKKLLPLEIAKEFLSVYQEILDQSETNV